MKLFRWAIVVVGLLSATASLAAEGKETLISIQIMNGTADLYSPNGADYISAYEHSENGRGVQVWRLMSKDYAFNFTLGIGGFSETDSPGPGAPVGATDAVYSQSSWTLRLGGDRAVKIGDRAIVYFGPGIEFWSGSATLEGGAGGPGVIFETEDVGRVSLAGRVGGVMMLNEKLGFNIEVGRYIGRATAEDGGAEAKWWPSGFQAAGGLTIRL